MEVFGDTTTLFMKPTLVPWKYVKGLICSILLLEGVAGSTFHLSGTRNLKVIVLILDSFVSFLTIIHISYPRER